VVDGPFAWGANNWSSSNTSVATVTSSGTESCLSPGTTTITAFMTVPKNLASGDQCLLHNGTGTGSGPMTVQVPTFFNGTSADPLISPNCDPLYIGGGADMHYQVADQNGVAIALSGMTPQEHFTVNGTPAFSGFRGFATPPTTDSSGRFNDNPVGTCFKNSPPLTTNPCVDVVQTFNIVMPSGTTFPISTTTTRRDCAKGIRIQVSNPAPGASKTFSNGTVN